MHLCYELQELFRKLMSLPTEVITPCTTYNVWGTKLAKCYHKEYKPTLHKDCVHCSCQQYLSYTNIRAHTAFLWVFNLFRSCMHGECLFTRNWSSILSLDLGNYIWILTPKFALPINFSGICILCRICFPWIMPYILWSVPTEPEFRPMALFWKSWHLFTHPESSGLHTQIFDTE